MFPGSVVVAVESINLCDDAGGDNHEVKALKRDLGVRLNYLAQALRNPMFRFIGIVSLFALDTLEEFIELLFSESTVVTNKRDVQCPEHSTELRSHTQSSTKLIFDMYHNKVTAIWDAFTDPSAKSPWSLAMNFWPHGRPQAEMHRTIQRAVLTLCTELAFRYKMSEIPQRYGKYETADSAAWDSLAQQFVDANSCCLGDVAACWQDMLSSPTLPVDMRGSYLRKLYLLHAYASRSTTLSEEHWHAFLRDVWSPLPSAYGNQCCRHVLELLRRIWEHRGGRNLSSPPPKLKAVMRKLSTRGFHVQRTIYKRKPGAGKWNINYMHHRLAEDGILTPEERHARQRTYFRAWDDLPSAEQQRLRG